MSDDIQQYMQRITEQHIQENPEFAEGNAQNRKEEWEGEMPSQPQNQPQPQQSPLPPNPFQEEEQEQQQQQPQEEAPTNLGEFERIGKLGKDVKPLEYKEGILAGNTIVVKSLDNKGEMKALEKSAGFTDDIKAKVFNMYKLCVAIQNVNGEDWPTRKAMSDKDFDKVIEERFLIILDWFPPLTNIVIRDYIRFENELAAKAEYAKKE